MSKGQYFNFPIHLLNSFLLDSKTVLNQISDYSIYVHSLILEEGDEMQCFKSSASYFSITMNGYTSSYERGKRLHENTPDNSPKVGLSLKIYWDFYSNDKNEFDKVCLLGFLAIKSILQQKPYCKIDNKFMLSRMDGKAKSHEFKDLTPKIQKYANEYQTKKIKYALRDNWGLITYSRYTRGFYVSFKLTPKQLIMEAEKRRISTKEKQYKAQEKQALKEVMEQLNKARP